MPKIFLSHSSRDKFFVRRLAESLQANGVQIWLDEAEINVGDSLTDKIGRAIDETDFFGVVLSHNSVGSEWVQRELRVAMQKELSARKVVILPILIEPVEIPPFLRDKLYADFTSPEPDHFDASFKRLLKAVGVRPLPEASQAKEDSERRVEPPKAVLAKSAAATELANFQDLRITGLDEVRSYKPDPSKLLYNMYLELSSTPTDTWRQIFEAERRFPRHSMWRRAWIERDSVIIYCVPEELVRYHLQDLKVDVSATNERYRKYLTDLAQRDLKRFQQEHKESSDISDLKVRLKFD